MSNINGKSSQTGKKPIWKRFLKDQDGNVLQLLALSALPMFLAVGAAVDMMRASREQTAFYSAVDAAALAIAGDDRSATVGVDTATLATNKVALQELARKYILADYKADSGQTPTISADVTVTGESVVLTSSLTFPTTIMSLAGVKSMTINASSTIKKAMRPIELTMVMDTTGSMAGSKMSGAKSAAHTLLNTIYSGSLASAPRSEYLRVSLVPFAAAVRLDQAASDFDLNWIDTSGANPLSRLNFDPASPLVWNNYYAWGRTKANSATYNTWNGCVEARMPGAGIANYVANDAAPTSTNPATLFPAYFVPDVPGTASSGSSLTSSTYGSNYITTSGTPNEKTGLATTDTNSSSYSTTAKLLKKQLNYAKYDGVVIGTESSPVDTQGEGPWDNCAASKVVPMTYDRAKIETGIDLMQAQGNTLIPEGLGWGWRTISPGAPFTKVEGSGSIPAASISPYGDPRWQKVMILMTDGDNNANAGSGGYNGSTYSAYGFVGEQSAYNRFGTTNTSTAENALDTNMLAYCQAIKDKDIELYVTSFGSGITTQSLNNLQACATDASHYYHSSTPGDLVSFFDHVGANVLNKMIYVSK